MVKDSTAANSFVNKVKKIFRDVPKEGIDQLMDALNTPCKSPPNTLSSNYSEDVAYSIMISLTENDRRFNNLPDYKPVHGV